MRARLEAGLSSLPRLLMRQHLVVALAVLGLVLPICARATVPANPTFTGPIASTPTNPVWMASQIDLSTYGYVEEEYFISGTANEYKLPLTAPPTVTIANVPYTTRILVRRPEHPSNFSGKVILEPIHPGNSGTAAALAVAYRWIYLNGDTWVGVQQPGDNNGPQAFNPTRYSVLTYLPALPIYDILSQVAALLQGSSNPIHGFQVPDVIMTGFSFTCNTVTSYINDFHTFTTLVNGRPIVSGYVAGGCSVLITPINVPVIRANTQLDFDAATRQPDKDSAPGQFRLYEIAGASHLGPADSLFASSPKVLRLLAPVIGSKPLEDYQECKEFGAPLYAAINDFPKGVIFDGIFRNIENWIRYGKPPPHAQPFVTNSSGQPILDQYGNFQGGVRTPYVDEPISTRVTAGTNCFIWGYQIPLSQSTLEALYHNHDSYVREVATETHDLVKERWVTDDDAKQLINQALNSSVPTPLDASLPAYFPPANGPRFSKGNPD